MNRQSYLAQFHKFQQNREQHFAPKLFSALRSQYLDFIKAKQQGKSDSYALLNVSSHRIYSVLKVLYLDAGVHYGSLVYSQLPKAPKKLKRRAPIGFNEEITELINAYFEGDILNFSEGITDTTRDLVRVVLSIAYEEGRSLNWVVDQLTTESYDLTRNRSRLIARTETVTATNQAGFFASAKTGLLTKKIWLSAGDARVRLDHQLVNDSKIDMEDFFTVGDSRMLVPGARVQENGLPTPAKEVCNCRCVCLYEPVRFNGKLVEYDYGIWQPIKV